MCLFHFLGDYEVLDAANLTTSGNFTGRYRSYRGVSVPTPCPAGSFCVVGTSENKEFLCPAGTYSNKTGLYNSTQCTPCDPGKYCSGEGTCCKLDFFNAFLQSLDPFLLLIPCTSSNKIYFFHCYSPCQQNNL